MAASNSETLSAKSDVARYAGRELTAGRERMDSPRIGKEKNF
jgi:hypothetical protein